jgi:hypothetical protein
MTFHLRETIVAAITPEIFLHFWDAMEYHLYAMHPVVCVQYMAPFTLYGISFQCLQSYKVYSYRDRLRMSKNLRIFLIIKQGLNTTSYFTSYSVFNIGSSFLITVCNCVF